MPIHLGKLGYRNRRDRGLETLSLLIDEKREFCHKVSIFSLTRKFKERDKLRKELKKQLGAIKRLDEDSSLATVKKPPKFKDYLEVDQLYKEALKRLWSSKLPSENAA